MVQVHLCSTEAVPLGEGIRVENSELPEPIAVFNCDGDFYAISDTCSHGQSSLAEGEVENCQVECTLHWGRFDLRTGKACALPALQQVRAYPVTVTSGQVYVTLTDDGGQE